MAKQWDADIHITPEIAHQVISAQFPELRPVEVQPFSEGWDNVVYAVNDWYLFRFPRRELVLPVLDNALRIMPLIAEDLPLPVPTPQFIGEASPDYPYPFFGYRKMAGQSATELMLNDAVRIKFAPVLGQFLKTLHQFVDVAEDSDLPVDPYNKANPEKLLGKISKALENTRHHFDRETLNAFKSILEALPTQLRVPYVFNHGDFYSRHLLIDPQQQTLTGVIDWDDIHIGHPALDLSIGWSFLPVEALEPFLEAYGGIDEETYHLARTQTLFYGLVLLDYGLDQADEPLVWEARWMLKRVLVTP
jgi:aminoglycoside phosphotransferase (APT) family kinase protein